MVNLYWLAGKPIFIDTVRQKCTEHEKNYYSSKGELAALYFAFENSNHLLPQMCFWLVLITQCCILGEYERPILINSSYFDFSIEHKAGTKLVDVDHISHQPNVPGPTTSEATGENEKFH